MAFKSLSDVGGTILINDSREITSKVGGDPVFGKHQNNASGVPTKYYDRLFAPLNTTTGVNIGDKWIYAGQVSGSGTSVTIPTGDYRASNPKQRTFQRKILLNKLVYTAANSTDYLIFRLRFSSTGTYASTYLYASEWIHYTTVGTSRSNNTTKIYPLGTNTSRSTLGNGITGGTEVRYRNAAEINIMGQSKRLDFQNAGEANKFTTLDWHIGYEDFANNGLANASRVYRNIVRGYASTKTTVGETDQLEFSTVSGSTITIAGHAYDYSRSL